MNDRVILITGAGSGIGRAIALLSADLGARLAIVDLNLPAARATAEEASRRGASAALAIEADVSVAEDVERAFVQAEQRLGVPTAVCANAAIDRPGKTHELTSEDWQHVIGVNLSGVFHTSKYAIQRLLHAKRPGSIVCVSSSAGMVAFGGGGADAYSASKGGVSALVRCLAVEHAKNGIRVNAIVPGTTETPLAWANVEANKIPELRRQLSAEIPLGRLAQPEEPARAVLWLFSEESAYVTGSHLVCDGGILAKASISF